MRLNISHSFRGYAILKAAFMTAVFARDTRVFN